jgi:2-dehydropantoate 2-reductase
VRICVFGAGAVGANLAVRLARAGHDLCIVARGEHLSAVQRNGIVVEAGAERIAARVRASDQPADLGQQDLVISTLKANSLAALGSGVAPLLGAQTAVVFAQNGIPWWYLHGLSSDSPTRRMATDLSFLDPGGRLAAAVDDKRIIGAIVYSANTMVSPGVVNNSSPDQNRLHVGELDDARTDRISALRALLDGAGIQSPEVTNLRQELWQKILSNLVTGATVLVEEPTSEMMADPNLGALAKRLVDEGVAIAKAHGMTLKPLMPNVPVGKKSAILQDFESRRPMEVDVQFRAPVAFATAAKVDAPVLETVAALVSHRAAAKGLYQRS